KPMPLPSSTAFTTLTGCDGLAVEQALIATSWAPPSDTDLAGAIPSVANAKTARPAVIVANLRLMSHLLTMLGQGGIASPGPRDGGGPGTPLCAPSQCGADAQEIGERRRAPALPQSEPHRAQVAD